MASGHRVYSAAYIMPPLSRGEPKHEGHLRLLEDMMAQGTWRKVQRARDMAHAYSELLAFRSIGPFLAYQFMIDLNYSEILAFSEMDFVHPGPGALRGIAKCFVDTAGLDASGLVRWVCDNQESHLDRLELVFPALPGRRLQLIDCQNLFCEIDKYSRVAFPQLNKPDRQTRIKQRFRPQEGLPAPWFPPKWGVNERIEGLYSYNTVRTTQQSPYASSVK
jgi:hypothetical protein